MPQGLEVIKRFAVIKSFSDDNLTLAFSKRRPTSFTDDTKIDFEKHLAQIFGRKINVDYVVEENLEIPKTAETKKATETEENPAEMSFLDYTLKLFETNKFEKINEE
ncbi:MAG: hypothetical protein IJT73_04375 [Selenomonadaceae bacterium]|nr:hypothetical protein [Selenomonadaceae bacterium]